MSQNARILSHLKEGKTLTPLEALDLFGCFRLSGRIQDLEAEGHKIESKLIELPNGKRVSQYRMISSDDLFLFKSDPLGRKVAV